MADAVTTQVLANGPKNLVLRCTNLSDGTGETGVTKFDATSATYAVKGQTPGIYARVKRLQYDIRSGGLRIRWDATTDEDWMVLDGHGDLTFDPPQGTPNIAGRTGSLLFTTVGFMINSGYSVTLTINKNVPQY